jgi:hypothetical protein
MWLPSGFRTRAQCFQSLWLPFGLDGYTPAAAASAPALLIATGPAEVGWLAFHITVFPIAALLALLSLLVHVPFGVVWFARQGHRIIIIIIIIMLPIKGHRMWLNDSMSVRALDSEPSSAPASGRPSISDAALRGGALNKHGSADVQQSLRQQAWRNAAAASIKRSAAGQLQRARRASVLGLMAAGSGDLARGASVAAAAAKPKVSFVDNKKAR